MKKLLILSLILACCISFSNAQSYFQVQVGLSLPNGDFADDDYNDAIFAGSGYASTGLDLGIKYYSPLKKGLSMVLGVNALYNPMSSDFKDEFEDDLEAEDIVFPKYINIPVMGGFNYQLPLADNLALFGEATIGANVLIITNLKAEDDDYEYKLSFTPSAKLAFSVGGGLMIQNKYSLGLHYYGLGSYKCKYESKVTYDGDTEKDKDKFDKALDLSAITLTLGIRL